MSLGPLPLLVVGVLARLVLLPALPLQLRRQFLRVVRLPSIGLTSHVLLSTLVPLVVEAAALGARPCWRLLLLLLVVVLSSWVVLVVCTGILLLLLSLLLLAAMKMYTAHKIGEWGS